MEGKSVGAHDRVHRGLLSFLSPCVLPLIPSYVTFITGLSLEDVQNARRAALVHSLLFVARLHPDLPRASAPPPPRSARCLAVLPRLDQPHRRRADHRVRPVHARRVQHRAVLARAARPHRRQAARLPRDVCSSASRSAPAGRRASGRSSARSSRTRPAPPTCRAGSGCCSSIRSASRFRFWSRPSPSSAFSTSSRRMKRQMLWITRASGVLMIASGMLMVTNYFTVLAAFLNQFTPQWMLDRL